MARERTKTTVERTDPRQVQTGDELWLASVRDRGVTGRQAAERFVREYWREPRKIADYDGLFFCLVDGTVWYRLREAPYGWDVLRTTTKVEDKPG